MSLAQESTVIVYSGEVATVAVLPPDPSDEHGYFPAPKPGRPLDDFLRDWTIDDIRAALADVDFVHDSVAAAHDVSGKIEALGQMEYAFNPTEDMVRFTCLLFAAIKKRFESVDFTNPEYRQFFVHVNKIFASKKRIHSQPHSKKLSGGCFTVSGPSLTGKTAFLQRIRYMLGDPFEIMGVRPSPARMWCVPVLPLTVPACGSVEMLLVQMREWFVAEIGGADAPPESLSQLDSDNKEQAAIALCTIFNVAVILIDGADFPSMSAGGFRLWEFLKELQRVTGIPVVIAGTDAFMHVAGYYGSRSSNLLSGPALYFEPFEEPSTFKKLGHNDSRLNHLWLWSMSNLPSKYKPADLDVWMNRLCLGRWGWLIRAYRALHIFLLTNPTYLAKEPLTMELVTTIVERELKNQRGAMDYVLGYERKKNLGGITRYGSYMDHLPHEAFNEETAQSYLKALMQ